MRLYCVRHGQACRTEIDSRSPLTDLGSAEVEKIGRHLAKCGVEVQHILHSGKLRAQQTADILARALKVKTISECPTLLNDENGVNELAEMVRFWTDDTMLVGHLPLMPQFVNALITDEHGYQPIIHYPPATIVCLEYLENRYWSIRWIINPEIIT